MKFDKFHTIKSKQIHRPFHQVFERIQFLWCTDKALAGIGEGLGETRTLWPWLAHVFMSKKTIQVSELLTFDPARYLRDDEDIAAYLTQVIENGDAGELAQALGIAARARGMAQIAEAAGIGRESLYKALRADASPRFDTIAKVCKALGVRLVVQAVHPA